MVVLVRRAARRGCGNCVRLEYEDGYEVVVKARHGAFGYLISSPLPATVGSVQQLYFNKQHPEKKWCSRDPPKFWHMMLYSLYKTT